MKKIVLVIVVIMNILTIHAMEKKKIRVSTPFLRLKEKIKKETKTKKKQKSAGYDLLEEPETFFTPQIDSPSETTLDTIQKPLIPLCFSPDKERPQGFNVTPLRKEKLLGFNLKQLDFSTKTGKFTESKINFINRHLIEKQSPVISNKMPLPCTMCIKMKSDEEFAIPEIINALEDTYLQISILQKNTIKCIGFMIDKKIFYIEPKYFKNALKTSWELYPIFSDDYKHIIAIMVLFANNSRGLLLYVNSEGTLERIKPLIQHNEPYQDTINLFHANYLSNLVETINFDEN